MKVNPNKTRFKLKALKPTLARKISPRAAQREIYQYIKSHPDVYPDEIADDLNLDLETVMDVVIALMSKRRIGESTRANSLNLSKTE